MKEIQILPLREELRVMSNNLFNVNRISDYSPCFIAMLKYQQWKPKWKIRKVSLFLCF